MAEPRTETAQPEPYYSDDRPGNPDSHEWLGMDR